MISKPIKIHMPLYNMLNMLREDEDKNYTEIICKLIKCKFDESRTLNIDDFKDVLTKEEFENYLSYENDFNYKKYTSIINNDDINDATKRQNYLITTFYDSKYNKKNSKYVLFFVEADYNLVIGVVIDDDKSQDNLYYIFDMNNSEDKYMFIP